MIPDQPDRERPELTDGALQPQPFVGHVAQVPQDDSELPLSTPSTLAEDTMFEQQVLGGGLRDRPRPSPEAVLAEFAHQRFKLLELLGRGGMGFVYKAIDQLHHTTVALKLLPRSNPHSQYRFKQEFRTLTNLSHPNLVVLHELFAESEQWFFTMELIDGVPFGDFVRPTGFQNWDADCMSRLRAAMRQLVEGVAFLHRAGFIHRDLKPSNVLVTRDGRVVVMDLGLTRAQVVPEWELSSEAGFCGTAAYMAPEQAAHQPTEASDWYSVGVMLFEALTGRLPFVGATTEVLVAKQQRAAPEPRDFASEVPDDLNTLCVNLLDRDPQARCSFTEILEHFAEPSDIARCTDPPRVPEAGDFVGRSSELRELDSLFHRSRNGETVCVFVAGHSGMGKTMLIEHFLEQVHRTDRQSIILAGRCYESESVPFKVFDGLLDAITRRLSNMSDAEVAALLPRYAGALASVFPVLQRVGSIAAECRRSPEALDRNELRRRAFYALKEFLGRLADRVPVVVFVDDIQWGDEDSAELFTALLRPPDAPCLLLIGAHRRENVEHSVFLRALERRLSEASGINVQRMLIEALPHSDAAQLANRFLNHLPGDHALEAQTIAREASGNPFFVRELAALATDSSSRGAVTLDSLLLNRFQRLPPEAQRLLEVIAVAGQPLVRTCVLAAARQLGVTTDVPFEQLRAERLVRATGPGPDDPVVTYHDRIRETVVRQLSSSDLTLLHGLLAETMQHEGSVDAESVAHHWDAADQPQRAFEWFQRAADQAVRQLAFDRAASLLGRLLQSPALNSDDEGGLRRRFADALAASGRGVLAAQQYLTLAQNAGLLEALDLRCKAANQLLISGRVDDGLSQLRAVLRELKLPVPQSVASTLPRLLLAMAILKLRGLKHELHSEAGVESRELLRIDACWSATTGLSVVHTLQGAFYQSLGMRLALKAGEPKRIARSLLLQAAHTATAGTAAAQKQARQLLQVAQEKVHQLDDEYLNAFSVLADGMVNYLGGKWSAAAELCETAQRRLRESSGVRTWEFTTAQVFEAWALFYLGRIRQLSQTVTSAQQEARDRDNLYALVNSSAFAHAEVLMAEDKISAAESELAEVFKLWNTSGFTVQHVNATSSAAQLLIYQGQYREAWDMLADAWKRLHSSQLSRVQIARVFHGFIGGRCALGLASSSNPSQSARPHPKHFFKIAQTRARRLGREGGALATGFSELLESGIARHCGQRELSIERLKRALSEFQRGEMQLFAAATQWRLGEILENSDGAERIAAAEEWMRCEGIPRPDRLTSVFVP